MPDQDWSKHNKGPLATMPFYEGVGKDGPGYVGVDKVHEDDRYDMVRGHIKVRNNRDNWADNGTDQHKNPTARQGSHDPQSGRGIMGRARPMAIL